MERTRYLFRSRSLFFSVFRLLPLLNDEYTLPPPAGKELLPLTHAQFVRARLKSLRCVPVRHMAQDTAEHGDATVGVGVGEFSGD